MIRSATLGLTLLLALPAAADDSIDINFGSSGSPGDVGIDNCETQLSTSFSLDAAPTFDAVDDGRTPVFRIYFYAGATVCTRADGLSECPSATTDAEGNVCGCISEREGGDTTLSASTTLNDMVAEASTYFCVDNAAGTIKFASEIYYAAEGDLSAESFLSAESETITIDRTRPAQPAAAPRVASAENALQVTVDEVSGAETYEICVRDLTEQLSPVDGADVTNDTLRAGFTTCRSSGVTAGSAYRFTGLTNDANYEVVYAAIDSAGNRGPNSDSATGQALSQRDFAEQYTSQIGEGRGESGGFCAATPGRTTGDGWWLLGFGALWCLRRRRNK